MEIVIPYKSDIHEGEELRYCLRSIEKNLTGFTDLLIIGRPPEWFKGKWIYSQDYAGRKQYTIYQKLLLAGDTIFKEDTTWDSPEYFIMFNDDHFVNKPIHVRDFKYWHNGPLANELNRGLSARYWGAVKRTLEFIPDGLNYDIHTPIKYNKKWFKNLFHSKTDEICIKSYYCNSWQMLDHLIEYMDDCKIDTLLSEEAIKVRIKDRLFFSTSANAIREPMKKVLEELFPNKSRWEK